MRAKSGSQGILNNWQIKIICFLLAVLVYYVFAFVAVSERAVTLPLEIKMPAGYSASSLVPENADVVIRGSEKQIHMIDVSRIKLFADFSKVNNVGVASVPVQIDYTDLLDYINATDVSIVTKPSVIKIYFE